MDNKNYTREELIEICEKAFTLQSEWRNRDSASSHIQLGSCYALLKAGCYFEVQYTEDGSGCSTDERTIWLQFWVHDFMWFESDAGMDVESPNLKGNESHEYHFYLPTMRRLSECDGNDWY